MPLPLELLLGECSDFFLHHIVVDQSSNNIFQIDLTNK